MATATETLVDVELVLKTRAKYREERDKRLRSDGNEQYVEMNKNNQWAKMIEDPYVTIPERAPLTDETEVIIIGGGYGGLLAGARLREVGIEDIRIVEKGGDFGGTWYWNRYPGACCDIESYVYLPLLEETGFTPEEKYTRAPEMLAHSKRIGDQYDLYKNATLGTEVTALRWDDGQARWIVETNRGDRMRGKFVINNNGPLHKPKLPGVPGLSDFKGRVMHTSRWDYEYTGGNYLGNLTKLADKRVGLIGTGATAIQAVPHVGAGAKQLYVFQRTPSSVDIRNHKFTTPEYKAEFLSKPGWQKERRENQTAVMMAQNVEVDLVNDGWSEIIKGAPVRAMKAAMQSGKRLTNEEKDMVLEYADAVNMNRVRARADAVVKDANTAEALKPYYRQFCKRPCFSDEYLDTFNRPNVALVDTAGKGIDRITATGIVANGKEYEVDCIIYATGFEVGTSYSRRAGFDIFGRNGLPLSEYWKKGVRSLHGTYVRGFPNLFVEQPAQGPATGNVVHGLDEMAIQFAALIKLAKTRNIRTVEVTMQAEDDWIAAVVKATGPAGSGTLPGTPGFNESCTPGYYNGEGTNFNGTNISGTNQIDGQSIPGQNPYPNPLKYFNIVREFRDAGFPGLDFTPEAGAPPSKL